MASQMLLYICSGIAFPCQLACLVKLLYVAMLRLPSWLRMLRSRCEQGRNPHSSDQLSEELSAQIAKLIETRRLHLARQVTLTAWVFSSILGIQIMLEALRPGTGLGNPNAAIPRMLFIVVLTPPCFIQRFFERRFYPWMLMQFSMGLLCSICLLDAPDERSNGSRMHLVSLAAVVFSLIYLDFRSVLLPNIVLTVLASISQVVQGQSYPLVIAMESLSLGIRLGMFIFTERTMRAWTGADVKANSERNRMSVALQLLGMICDVVVELDESFSLREHSQSLASLLLHGSRKTLKGSQFASFVADEADQQRLKTALGKSGRSTTSEDQCPPPPCMLSLVLRDCIGNRVSTIVYAMPFLNTVGEFHYLVGLREDTQDTQRAWKGGLMPEAVLRPDQADRLKEAAFRKEPLPLTDPGSQASGRQSRSIIGMEDEGPLPDAARTLEVDLTAGMPVRFVDPDLAKEFALSDIATDQGGGIQEFASLVMPLVSDDEEKAGGSMLLRKVQETIVYTVFRSTSSARRTRCSKCLGDWDLLASHIGNPDAVAKTAVKRELWVTFHTPLRESASGAKSVSISIAPVRPARRNTEDIRQAVRRMLGKAPADIDADNHDLVGSATAAASVIGAGEISSMEVEGGLGLGHGGDMRRSSLTTLNSTGLSRGRSAEFVRAFESL